MRRMSQLVQPAARRGATWLTASAVGGSMALMIPVRTYSRKAGATTSLPGIPHGKQAHVPMYSVHTRKLKSLIHLPVGAPCLRRLEVQSKA